MPTPSPARWWASRVARASACAYVSRRSPHTSASWSGISSTTRSHRSARLNSTRPALRAIRQRMASEEVGAAVDGHGRAHHEAAQLGAEEDDHGGHLFGKADAADVVRRAVVARDGLV